MSNWPSDLTTCHYCNVEFLLSVSDFQNSIYHAQTILTNMIATGVEDMWSQTPESLPCIFIGFSRMAATSGWG